MVGEHGRGGGTNKTKKQREFLKGLTSRLPTVQCRPYVYECYVKRLFP